MAKTTLAERVAELERRVAELEKEKDEIIVRECVSCGQQIVARAGAVNVLCSNCD